MCRMSEKCRRGVERGETALKSLILHLCGPAEQVNLLGSPSESRLSTSLWRLEGANAEQNSLGASHYGNRISFFWVVVWCFGFEHRRRKRRNGNTLKSGRPSFRFDSIRLNKEYIVSPFLSSTNITLNSFVVYLFDLLAIGLHSARLRSKRYNCVHTQANRAALVLRSTEPPFPPL